MRNLPDKLNTLAKLRIARMLHFAVRTARKLAGKNETRVTCARRGIRWSLDLEEGIDLSIFALGVFEARTSKAILARLAPGAVVLDIGANIGAHALPMARAVSPGGKVYAIEPTDWAYERLSRNLDLNPELGAALEPVQALLTDGESAAPLELHSSWNLFRKDAHPTHGGTLQPVTGSQAQSLDQLVDRLGLTRLDLVKMDIDGLECQVLRGARRTLGRFRPAMILEVHPSVLEENGDSLDALVALLKELGYALKSEDGRRLLPTDAAKLRKLIPAGGGINALACPSAPGSKAVR